MTPNKIGLLDPNHPFQNLNRCVVKILPKAQSDDREVRKTSANVIRMLENSIYHTVGTTMRRWEQKGLIAAMEYTEADRRFFLNGQTFVRGSDDVDKVELSMEAQYLDVMGIACDMASFNIAGLSWLISSGYNIYPEFDPPHRYASLNAK